VADLDPVSPLFREETVTDLDASYPSGMCQFTLHDGDTIVESDDRLVITQQARPGYSGEDIVLYKRRLEWTSTRRRVIKWPIKKPVTAPAEPTPVADATGEP
jgi:hypothetical protein